MNNFVVDLTATAERNLDFTGTNTVTARDQYNNVITDFDASVTNVTMSVTSGGGAVYVAGGEDGVLDQETDFVNGVANLTTIGIRYANGTAGDKTIQAAAGSATGSDIVAITVNEPSVSNPSPADYAQISTGAASQTFTATFTETNSGGSYKLYWRVGDTLQDAEGLATDSTTVAIGGGVISATLNSTQLSALTGNNFMFWWFGGVDGAGNALVGTPTTESRQNLILDPTVTFTGTQIATGFSPGQTGPFVSIDATGEMTGMSVTITRLQFSKSGSAVNADIDALRLYVDADRSNDVSQGDVLLQEITVDSDLKLNSPNFNSFGETVTVSGTNTTRFLLVVVVAADASPSSKIGYRINDTGGVTLGTAVADIGGSFPVPDGIVDISLPVELASFTGETSADGVTLLWSTASEVQNAGFYVLRAMAQDGPFEYQSEFILGQGTTPLGHDYTWTDTDVVPGTEYWYALEQRDFDGTVTREESTIQIIAAAPTEWRLRPNAPNPFNPTTTFAFDLPQSGEVHLMVYDVTGRNVRTLVSGNLSAGIHHVRWDGTDDAGRGVASGVYVVRFIADNGRVNQVQRVSLVR